jgi:hypothetical protein
MTGTRLDSVLRRQRRSLVQDVLFAATVAAAVGSALVALG